LLRTASYHRQNAFLGFVRKLPLQAAGGRLFVSTRDKDDDERGARNIFGKLWLGAVFLGPYRVAHAGEVVPDLIDRVKVAIKLGVRVVTQQDVPPSERRLVNLH